MSYHGMGVTLSPSLMTPSLQVSAPLQLVNLPKAKGSIRVDGDTTRRIEKDEGQRSMGVSVPAGGYNIFFRPQGGRYKFLGGVRVPEDGSVTFDPTAGEDSGGTELWSGPLFMNGGGEEDEEPAPATTGGRRFVQPDAGDEPIPPGERRLPPPAANGRKIPGGGPTLEPEAELRKPPAPQTPNWVPWAIGAGAIALVGLGAWWLTR